MNLDLLKSEKLGEMSAQPTQNVTLKEEPVNGVTNEVVNYALICFGIRRSKLSLGMKKVLEV